MAVGDRKGEKYAALRYGSLRATSDRAATPQDCASWTGAVPLSIQFPKIDRQS
jgi:hypothetical protein